MAVRAKLSYCLKARKTPSSLPKAFNNGIKLLSVLTKKNKIAYLALNFLSRIHKNDRNQ